MGEFVFVFHGTPPVVKFRVPQSRNGLRKWDRRIAATNYCDRLRKEESALPRTK